MIWALDIILLMLVVVCTCYCWLLNRRIKGLQDSKEEFAKMLQDLDIAINTASNSVGELQSLSNSTSSELMAVIKRAEELKSELLMLNKVGNDLADRLEGRISDIRLASKSESSMQKNVSATSKSLKTKKSSKKKSDTPAMASEKEGVEYKNEYDPKILEITTEDGKKSNMDQNSYFESLKKISITK